MAARAVGGAVRRVDGHGRAGFVGALAQPLCEAALPVARRADHEDEAVALDYHLLIKPVLPNKLRAMIAFKLGVR